MLFSLFRVVYYYHTKCPLRLCLAFTTFGHWNLSL